jgi:hypothetical protein
VNNDEFVSKEQADEVVGILNEERVGGGVKRLYEIKYPNGPFSAPAGFFHVDFKNGAKGHNVGLMRKWLGFGWMPRWWGLQILKVDVARNAQPEEE